MSKGFVGKVFLERSNGDSPVSYTRVCETFAISGLGQTRTLEDDTTFCSGGSKEYIGGLKDGTEITVDAKYVQDSVALAAMINDATDDDIESVDYRVVVEQKSPHQYFAFAVIPMKWEFKPSVSSRNTIQFGLKISGPISSGNL